ncbi:hypothetical protein GDO81_018322 [Engystomops pustulosus]|uniref:Uncharacterized protein n=1 Tax=Engystomops pustulosus TaxID=76066 RepID=A0AAV7A669_ENGPU|nr:hypothetical protein GDO81_018322 [Engystomops pustulosus]
MRGCIILQESCGGKLKRTCSAPSLRWFPILSGRSAILAGPQMPGVMGLAWSIYGRSYARIHHEILKGVWCGATLSQRSCIIKGVFSRIQVDRA